MSEKFESKLVPVLREGVEVVKVVFFKELTGYLSAKFPDRERSYVNKLSGAMINNLFGTLNEQEQVVDFVQNNKAVIREEMKAIATEFDGLKILLTDALRIQFMCDGQDGVQDQGVLENARDLGILIVERNMPMPGSFISMVRKIGESVGVLAR
ncbi:MAG: hypothetical protein KKB30_15460 [Proteobacteria bacterium]|nr:hypothetical protein [Pseudomonadota bacterium]MBU1716322.1 hypothetical protein [Pseudomonadota bacterium]